MSDKGFILKIPTQSTNLKIIRDFITDVAEKAGFGEEASCDIALAVDEASTNVIKHAYRGGDDKEITVNVKYDKSKIVITISDSGKGFKPDSVDDFDINEYLKNKKRGGLGVHLIKSTMDEVEFKSEPGEANSVKMIKYLPDTDS
ncbi:MAG: ATP-binding protein [Candidatus Marinimicrobia bacterium]|nr:ATP-binding protein [Candidatus Neomarinimicrobiota bacterium]